MKKFFKIVGRFFNVFIITAALVIIGGVIFLYAYPFNVAQFNKVDVINEVQAGGSISYKVDYCRYVGKGVPTTTKRYLVPKDKPFSNSIELSSSPNTETIDGKTGCRTTPEPITLPVEVATPTGEYQLLIQVQYCIFIGRCIPVEGRSDFFNVSKPSVPNQLGAINKQLEDINEYLKLNGDAVTNSFEVQEVPSVAIPSAPQQTQTPQNNSIAPQLSPSIQTQPLRDILKNTTNTIENITKMLGL